MTVNPALWLAQGVFYGFVLAQLAQFVAYATKKIHEVRTTLYTIGSVLVIYMALQVCWVLLL